MSVKNKTSLKSAKVWQRHALAQACFLVATGASTAAFAIDYTPGAAFSVTNATLTPGVAQGYDTYWSTGYNAQNRNYQYGAGQIDGTLPTNVFFSSLTGAGSTPVNINSNSLMLYSYGNQNTGAGLSLANLARVNNNNDGQLALNLQLFTGLAIDDTVDSFGTKSVLASVTNTGPYITQVGKASADLSLSGNAVGGTLSLNTVDTTVSGATPFGYASATKGSSLVTYGDNNNSGFPLSGRDATISTRGTTASVNLSNMQNTFNAYGTANVDTAAATVTVSQTAGAALASFAGNVNLNANTITAVNTSNAAVSVFEATAGSSAFTGSVAVTNIQTTKITSDVSATQTANVANGNVQANLLNTAGETRLTGTVNVNGNTVSAKALGNTAGARTSLGAMAAGNAILFDGNADITGTTAPMALGASGVYHSSYISSDATQASADLLINSVQRNSGNEFLAAVDPSTLSTKVDNLNGGRINQNGNTQSASASANLAGNLISAGLSASIGNITANAVIVNTQANTGTTVTASVQNSSQSVTVGVADISATSTGAVSVNDNSITATAEGNASASTLSLKAGNLNVGGNGTGLVYLAPSVSTPNDTAVSGLAASVLSSQKNNALTLTSNNEGNSVKVQFNTQEVSPANLGISASQVSVNGNNLLSTATGNAASNAVTVAATANAPGLNAGLGNSQYNTGSSTIAANAGFASALSVAITADSVASSQLTLNSNNLSATAKGNSANNNLTASATNASGQPQVFNGLFNSLKPFTQATDANGGTGVSVNADFALANAQADNGSAISAVLSGSSKIVTAGVDTASTLSANSNSLTAGASVNTSSNAVNLTINNMSGMVAGLSSSQGALDSMATASAAGEVSLKTGNLTGASNASLNTNTVSAAVSANAVTNTLALTATNASGRGTYLTYDPDAEENIDAVTATIGSGKAYVNADFALANVQNISSSSNFVAGTVSGIKAVTGNVTGSSLTVNANNTLASASANNASNSISLSAGQLTNPNTGLTSLQTMQTAAFKATVDDAVNTVGTGVIAEAASAAQIAVTNNVVKASAMGNVANNSVDMTGTNATGATLAYGPALISSDVAKAVATSPTNIALVSLQTSLGNELSAKLGDSGTLPKVGIKTDNVSAASTLSLTDNSLSTQVFNNSANNTVALNVTNLNSMTAGLASGQSVEAVLLGGDYTPLTATTDGRVKIVSGDVIGSSSLTASRNGLKSQVIGNSASNILSVTATNALGKNSDAVAEKAANATNRSASTDFALVTDQSVSASVMSATTHGYAQIASNAVTASALSVNDNSLTAYASANNVSNQLALATTNLTSARAGLANMQLTQYSAEVGATISDSRVDAAAAGNLNGAQVSVAGNTLKATALGNVANNQLNLTGSNATAGSVNLDGSYTQAGSNTFVGAGLALASRQESLGTLVEATNGSLSNPTFVQLTGYNVSNASALTLSNNSVGALTYVNNAANGMNVAVTNLNGMTVGLANGQYATGGGEKATADTVGEISANLGNVVGSSTLTMVANELSASSNVNYAGNALQVSSSQITGRNAITPSVTAAGGTQAGAYADLSVANQQKMANSGDFARASVTGTVKSDNENLTSSTVNVNGNSVSAYGSGNNANNGLSVNTTGLNTASLGLASGQEINNSANVKTYANGEISVSAYTLNGAAQSLNSNQIKATSVGNAVSNAMSVTASNASGSAANPVPTVTVGNVNIPNTNATADWNLGNSQLLANGSTIEAQSGLIGGTAATAKQYLGDLTNGSAVTLNGNALTATAFGNSATNASTAAVTNLSSMSIGLGNTQVATSSSPIMASTNGKVLSEVLQIAGSSLSVNNNQIAATALANTVSNTLDVRSTNVSGRNRNAATDLAANTVAADFALANAQTAIGGSSTSARTNGNVQTITDGEQVTNGIVSLNNNAVTAYASANQAVNGLNLAVTNLSNATVGLGSSQIGGNNSGVSALTTGNVSTSLDVVSNNAAVSVNANTVKATALGNLSTNQLSVSGTLAQSNSSVGSTAVNATSTTADFSVANLQQLASGSSVSAATSENGSTAAPLQIALSAADVNTGAALTLNQNTIASLSYANSASNQLNLGVGRLLGTSAVVLNNQLSDSGATSQANTKGQVALSATAVGIGGGASLAVNNNTVSAAAYSNSANNSLAVTSSNASGRSINPTTNLSAPSIKADFALLNAQTSSSNSTVNAQTTGSVQLLLETPLTGASVTDSLLSLNANTVSSYASANQAGNEISLAATKLSAATVGLASVQMATSGGLNAGTAGNVTLSAADIVNASLTVNTNTIKATALTNVATNQINVTGTNASSASSLATPSVNLTSTSADVSLANQQTATNNFSATAITSADGSTTASPSVVSMSVGAVSTNASLSVNNNAIAAMADANSASNQLTLGVSNVAGMSAAVLNKQLSTNGSQSTASTNGQVSMTANGVDTANLAVNNNTVAASAFSNAGTNTLAVSSTNFTGRSTNPVIDLSVPSTQADFALSNVQTTSNSANVKAETTGQVQLVLTPPVSGVSVQSSLVSLNANTVSAYANGNQAGNEIALNVTNLTSATAGLSSVQMATSGNSVKALTGGNVSLSAGEIANSTLTLNTNTVKATALTNLATNAIGLTGTNVTSNSSLATPSVSLTGASADVALANQQTATNNMGATAMTSADGVTTTSPSVLSMSVGAVNTNANLSVNNNAITAVANANSASNQLAMGVSNGVGMSAAVLNNQLATSGAQSLASTNGQVSMTANGVDTASLAVNNNTVAASAYGNAGTNILAVTSTNFSGRGTSPAIDMSVPSIRADFALSNVQTTSNGANVKTETTGQVQLVLTAAEAPLDLDPPPFILYSALMPSGALVNNSLVSVNGNTVSAYANGNQAGNEIALNVANLNSATAGLSSVQMATSANSVKALTGGNVSLSAGEITNSTLTLNTNTIKATALTNLATNVIGLTGTNVTSNSSLATPSVNLTGASADVALANQQTATNGMGATAMTSADGVTTASPSVVEMSVGAANNNASLSVNTNAIASAAYANSASNQLTLGVGKAEGMSAAVLNNQVATSSAQSTASTNGKVSMLANELDTAKLAVNSNTVAASAFSNAGTNTLAVTSTNFSGRAANPVIGVSVPSIQADFALSNVQTTSNGANVKAETTGQVQMLLTPPLTGVGVQDSVVAVNANTVSAYASGNQAGNEIALNVTNLNSATAGLSSVQTATSADSVKALGGGNLTLSAGEVANSSLTVNGNTVKAIALTNLATNAIGLTGTNVSSNSSLATPSVNLTGASADVALVNQQTAANNMGATAITSANGATPAAPDVAAPYVVEMVVGAVNSDASLSVNTNAISSVAYVNSASNTAALNATNLTAINAAVLNSQTGSNGASAASTSSGKAWMSVGGALDSASLAVNNNNVAASSYRNSANNTLTVASTNASGRGVAARETLASAALSLKNDFAVGNAQIATNGSSSQARASGAVELFADANTVTGSSLSLDTNTISAYASGNAAGNQLGLAVTQLSQASAGVASYQSSDSGASVTSEVVGTVGMTAGALDTATLSVKDNTIKSTALGNLANNALAVSGSAVTSTASGDVSSAATSNSASAKADFGLSNVQLQAATVTALATGVVKISTDNSTGSVTDANLSLTGNAVKSLAQGNSASNDLTITSTQQNGITAGLVSSQDSSAAVIATTSPTTSAFGISTAGLDNAKVVVSGNTASAVAGKNEAFNTLTVNGANIVGRGNNVTGSVVGTSSVTGADFAVINAQSASGALSASVDAGASGFVSSAGLTGGSVTVSGNTVLAAANANTAGNTLTLAATSSLEASGVVNNVQSLAAGSTVTASVLSSSALSVETDAAPGSAGSATIAVSGNVVKAAASANVASNALNASASSGISNAGAVTSPSGTTATPSFAVLNSQHTGSGSTVSSAINGFNMGGAQLNGALNSGGSASVTGNVVQSVAYGNSASNAIQVSSLPAGLNTASASITNVQYNLASVTSTITGVNVQGSGVNSSGNAGVNISGNSIVAMAAGNRVVNTITGR